MKNIVNWKIFGILLAACVITGVMALPYALALIPGQTLTLSPIIVIGTIIQTTVIFSIAIFVGLFLAKRVGLGMPLLEDFFQGKKRNASMRSIISLPVGLGVLAGLLIVLVSVPFQALSVDFLKAEVAVSTWKSLLVIFYGGIAEEVLLRLFLMTFLVWITFKIKKTPDGKPTTLGVWLAIILSSILFGLGHLPITGAITAITPIVILRAVVLNGIGGIIFGWLYWKKGLESAMISHFSADVVLHVVLPLVASLLL